VMVVNVSPAMENVPETKCSLEFASRARKVRFGLCVCVCLCISKYKPCALNTCKSNGGQNTS